MKCQVRWGIVVAAMVVSLATTAPAQYVTPKIGGGQVTHTVAPMIMPEIFFDGAVIKVLNASLQPFPVLDWDHAPILRPLTPPAAFDPAAAWSVLIGKAYNFQYGWNSGLLDQVTYPFPPGSDIWVREWSKTEGVDTYFKDGAYAPIFGTPDAGGNPSSDIWKWDRRMRHNTYAVPENFYGRIEAQYEVYLGRSDNGTPLVDPNGVSLYQSSFVTFRWTRPCPYVMVGDIDMDCVVDMHDLCLMSEQWIKICADPDWCDNTDLDRNGSTELTDALALAEHWLMDCLAYPEDPTCVPR